MFRARDFVRWLLTLASVLLILLYVLSLPFYSGSTLGRHLSWRFEHARLNIKYSPDQNPGPFYVDINSEGLKWAPEGRFDSWGSWSITLPLWMALVLTATPAGVLWRRHRRSLPGQCKRCRYDRKGLAPDALCPECGKPWS